MSQNDYPELLDLTPAYAAKVRRQGYLDITDIHPDDVLRTADPAEVGRWRGVELVINVKHKGSSYKTIVLTDQHHFFKLKPTPNQLMGRLRREFKIDYRYDIKAHAKDAGVKRQIPFICGDFWLMSVDQRRGNNYSWFRWHHHEEPWDFRGDYTIATHKDFIPLRLPHTRTAIKNRKYKCDKIAESLAKTHNDIVPTHLREMKFDVEAYHQKGVAGIQTNLVLRKVLSEDDVRRYGPRITNELYQGNFFQLDEMVDPDEV